MAPYKAVYPIQSYVEMVVSELAHELSGRGYRIEMLPSDNLSQLERIRFCGAVSIGVDVESFGNWEERFAAPLVVIDRDVPPTGAGEIYSIRSDENQAMLNRTDRQLNAFFRAGRARYERLPSAEEFAGVFGCSPAYFNDLLKHETGKDTARYVAFRELSCAGEALCRETARPE